MRQNDNIEDVNANLLSLTVINNCLFLFFYRTPLQSIRHDTGDVCTSVIFPSYPEEEI